MSTSNGINSDSFSRTDVIKTYQVVQYFGGILTQYPIVTNIAYNNTTGIITANGITSFQATSGTTQPSLELVASESNSSSRPGASVVITAGNGSGGSAAGQVNIRSGVGGGVSGSSNISVSNTNIQISDRNSGTLSLGSGGLQFYGGYNAGASISFSAGATAVVGGTGLPISLRTDSGAVIEVQEATPGTKKIGFFGQSPLSAKPTIGGSRGGNAALADLLTKLAALGLITDGTSA